MNLIASLYLAKDDSPLAAGEWSPSLSFKGDYQPVVNFLWQLLLFQSDSPEPIWDLDLIVRLFVRRVAAAPDRECLRRVREALVPAYGDNIDHPMRKGDP